MADPKDQEPAEGSRKTIEKELKRTDASDSKADSSQGVEQKERAQPGSEQAKRGAT